MGEWIRLNLSGRADELETYSMQDWARAGLDRSGVATVPMELFNLSDRVLDGQLSQQMQLQEGSRYFYRDWFGALAGPTAGYIADTGKVMQNMINDDGLTERDIHSIRRLMPYQNMFYLRQGLNMMEKEIATTTGAKPRKRRRSKTKGTFIK